MQVTTFTGEGATYRFYQGFDAITGVYAHEALNIRVFKRYALNANKEIVNSEIKIKLAIDPKTKRLIVVGGESRAEFKNKNYTKITELLSDDTEEIKKEIRKLLEEERLLKTVEKYDNPFIGERLEEIRRKINILKIEALTKGVMVDLFA
ncbi:MAG: hypothetical protein N2380_04305 [bacterium]|nr:hypothetical protein [bacterium]